MSNLELSYLRAASLLFDNPLLLGKTQGLLIGGYLSSRMIGQEISEPQGNRFKGEEQTEGNDRRWKGYAKIGNVARINLMGELVNRGAWMGSYSGMTSYEGFSEQLAKALADDEIEQIVLDVNSPGGQASGMVETSRRIRAAAQQKPVIAAVNSMAFSAAYGLISGATEIVATESSELGSIGVLLVHFDRSKALEANGVEATIIHAGNRKIDGHPFGPLEGESLKAIRNRIDQIMDQFVNLVSEHRGIDAGGVRRLEAGILSADEAISAGLADRIGNFDEIISDLNSRAPGGRTTSLNRRTPMSENKNKPAATNDAGISQADHDLAIATAKSDGFASGVKAEQSRFNTIFSSEGISGNASRMAHALDLACEAPEMDAEKVVAMTTKHVAEQPVESSAGLNNRESDGDPLGAGTGTASEHAPSGLSKLVSARVERAGA